MFHSVGSNARKHATLDFARDSDPVSSLYTSVQPSNLIIKVYYRSVYGYSRSRSTRFARSDGLDITLSTLLQIFILDINTIILFDQMILSTLLMKFSKLRKKKKSILFYLAVIYLMLMNQI